MVVNCHSPISTSTLSRFIRRSVIYRTRSAAIDEAHRVLRAGGWRSVFDGDYTTITVALSDHDPLQACVDAVLTKGLENRWLVRRLPALVRAAGFEIRA